MSVRSQFIAAVLAVGVVSTALMAGQKEPVAQAIQTEWRVTELTGEAVPPGVDVTMRFDAEGRVSGSGGCNRYFGSYQLTDGALQFGALGMTRMACPGDRMLVETRFSGAMAQVVQAGLDAAGALILKDAAGSPVIVAQPAGD